MKRATFPTLYQVSSHKWLTELSVKLSRAVTLGDIPDSELDYFSSSGFDWILLKDIWQNGSDEVFQTQPNLPASVPPVSYSQPVVTAEVTGYPVSHRLGGITGLNAFRERLNQRGIKLMLEFIANHTPLDHPWRVMHPDFYVEGDEPALARDPENYIRLKAGMREIILAHGKGPFTAGWRSTLQLNFGNPALQQALVNRLVELGGHCDGLCCGMASLVDPDIYEDTWEVRIKAFWPEAIRSVRARYPNFTFMAEADWNMDWAMHRQGFDYCFDKELLTRLNEGRTRLIRDHFRAELDYQGRLARFLETHFVQSQISDMTMQRHEASAVITYLSTGMRFFHDGQISKIINAPDDHAYPAKAIENFYKKLLTVLQLPMVKAGIWEMLWCAAAEKGDLSCNHYIAFAWQGHGNNKLVVAVNYSPDPGRCNVKLPFGELAEGRWQVTDLMNDSTYEAIGNELFTNGLHLNSPPWKYNVLSFEKINE